MAQNPPVLCQLSSPGRIGALQPHVFLSETFPAKEKPGESQGILALNVKSIERLEKAWLGPWGAQSPGPARALEQLQQSPLEFLSSARTGGLLCVLRKAAAENSSRLEMSPGSLPWKFTAPFLRQAARWEQRCFPSSRLIPRLRAAPGAQRCPQEG